MALWARELVHCWVAESGCQSVALSSPGSVLKKVVKLARKKATLWVVVCRKRQAGLVRVLDLK